MGEDCRDAPSHAPLPSAEITPAQVGELVEKIGFAAGDPGHFVGFKGSRSVKQWVREAITVVVTEELLRLVPSAKELALREAAVAFHRASAKGAPLEGLSPAQTRLRQAARAYARSVEERS